jgi:hypothetical protein
MVSCWNHLAKNRESGFTGPKLPFPEWCEWVIETPDSELDHHVASQVHDIVGRTLEMEGDCRLWIGMLEQLNACEKDLSLYVKRHVGVAGSAGGAVRHVHAPWPEFYDKRLLERIRDRFYDDMRLWMRLYEKGFWQSGLSTNMERHFVWSEAFQNSRNSDEII